MMSAIALKLTTRPADTKLTPDVARELCQRAGGKAYIAGSIASLGSEYVLELKAVNCQNGDPLAQEQATAAAKEKVLDTLGAAASRLRGKLGESLATVQKFDTPLEQATTSSLEALKTLTTGAKIGDQQGRAAELPYDQRAIELDPNFAMAYVRAGTDYLEMGEVGRAAEYYTKAFQLREHASEREKLVIAGLYYEHVTGELEKAAHTDEEWRANYPRSPGALLTAGDIYAKQGQYEQAVEVTHEALGIDPETGDSYVGLANSLLGLRRTHRPAARAATRCEPDYLQFGLPDYQAHS